MYSFSFKCLTLCAITIGLLGILVGTVTSLNNDETLNLDDNPEQTKEKRMDNMQYFGRLGKRRDSFMYAGRLGKKSDDKRPDPAMFGHLGKRGDDDEVKRLDSKSFFGRLGKRDSLGTDISDVDDDKRDFDATAFSGRLGKRGYDTQAYFGRLGKRTEGENDNEEMSINDDDKRYDSRMFGGHLGKKSLNNLETRVLLQKLADLTKRGVDPMAYFGRLGKRRYDPSQFFGRLG